MGNVIDLAAERAKRERAARHELTAAIGGALLVGVALWALRKYLAPELRRILHPGEAQ